MGARTILRMGGRRVFTLCHEADRLLARRSQFGLPSRALSARPSTYECIGASQLRNAAAPGSTTTPRYSPIENSEEPARNRDPRQSKASTSSRPLRLMVMSSATTGTRRRRTPRGLFIAGLFLVVTGVLGMHGLTSHGGASADHLPAAQHVAADAQMAESTLGQLDAATNQLVNRPVPSDAKSLAALCVAVLLTALALLLRSVSLSGRNPRLPLASRRCLLRIGGRGREPPFLSRLSVRRC